ncbi:hypothetical protein [Vibrio sp. D431a]|uniref:hypothetical protein n=1 Tax=Vibrio sp. D431a TaxID=2837388 RepID=UPI0025534AD7|nr:hypothetical protein [Vibrio sp. D431a]MDK9793270.1 hypothetical protein [Vibrio sp. D431a]
MKKLAFILALCMFIPLQAYAKENLSDKDAASISKLATTFPQKISKWHYIYDKDGRIILTLVDSYGLIAGICSETELRVFDCDFF